MENVSSIEIKALKRLGLLPLPTIDDLVARHLFNKASIVTSPATSRDLTGGLSASFAASITQVVSSQGATISAGGTLASSIKRQTEAQEWMHWKKYALEDPDFKDYKNKMEKEIEEAEKTYLQYIKSDKGQDCVSYESRRIATALCIGATALALNLPGLLLLWLSNAYLKNSRDISITEWVIQKVFRLRAFSSIKPVVTYSEGIARISW